MKKSIDPSIDSYMFVLPPEWVEMVQFETSGRSARWFKRGKMDELVSGIIRKVRFFRLKIEEDGQRVERRRVMRKCHLDGVSVPRNRAAAAFTIFEHFTGTERRNNTVSRAWNLGRDNLSKNLFN